ncbi:hypothetical protein SAMN05421688_1939 [Poseidonocella pacifica]|uniref:Panthothenate kinase n=1 Tax=Poseidonocella pacifica TaxID=871651 RepID=A0A1I0X6G4_9RHOB|nr:nucleoside triphosphate hydrolase [Poseidonocella pacifica]SFA96642.1 hypothetical protein SAMN05421688_1939 [Poseidonocella pacifica]
MTLSGHHISSSDLATKLHQRASGGRVLCAIAGAPASGKSTLADDLADRLNRSEPGLAAVLPMDGFHYDNLYLEPQGMLARKGAPETFDVDGLAHVLARLRTDDGSTVAVPLFDRSIEIARAGARVIPASVRVVIAEGNYLLLDRDPWRALEPLFDVTALVPVPEAELRRRLEMRWVRYGLSAAEMRAKIDGNDLPNGRLIQEESRPPDFIMQP